MVISFFNKKKSKPVPVETAETAVVSQQPIWAHLRITEERVRELVKIRIRYLNRSRRQVLDPGKPDLSGLLEDISRGLEARAALANIWQEEVAHFYEHSVRRASKQEFEDRITKNRPDKA